MTDRPLLIVSIGVLLIGVLAAFFEFVFGSRQRTELIESRANLTAALAQAEAAYSLLEAAFAAQNDAIYVYNGEGRLVMTNPAAGNHVERGASEQPLPAVLDQLYIDGGVSASATLRALRGETVVNAEGAAGNRFLEISSSPMRNGQGQTFGAVTVMHDITRRRRAEDDLLVTLHELESALAEKTVLLQEVHHRVKNNLAIICSLLAMKADAAEIPGVRLALEESRQRIHSIALIHEHLYGGDRLDRIDFADYARQLVAELKSALGAEAQQIAVTVRAEPIQLEAHRAVPCALILNELVTNAFKHAFSGEGSREIGISFRRSEPGWLELEICDNGLGYPESAGARSHKSVGLRIVEILVKQIEGSLRQQTGGGTCFVLRFPAGSQG